MKNCFKKLGCDPKLLAVPGNHDLQRPDADKAAVMWLEEWRNKPDVRESFWKKRDGEYREVINTAFAKYDQWWRNTPLKPEGVMHGELPGDFSCTFTRGDLRLGIAGLNSSFLQLTDKKDYEGRLSLHPRLYAVGRTYPNDAAKQQKELDQLREFVFRKDSMDREE